MKTQGISYHEAEELYFDILNSGESRATIFLSHTPLNYVIDTNASSQSTSKSPARFIWKKSDEVLYAHAKVSL